MNEREQIFREELTEMQRQNYIAPDEYMTLNEIYDRFTVDRARLYEMQTRIQQEQIRRVKAEAVKPQKVLTPQEVRERNITWILILGVIMVLLSGLLLATSNWNIMNDTVKTIVIALVGVLFFGTSIVANKGLKIQKTAFAFWVLGSLFLPVAVLSAGYFELFGKYLSVFGEGKYLFGAIGTTICLPVYAYSTKRYRHRLFAWFTLLALSIDVSFILAAGHPPVDVFYLGIVVYNGLMLLCYHKLKDKEELKLFIREMSLFTQVNLIISTIFLLFFYKDPQVYGFNVMLTSVLYILMVYSKQSKKEYSFVFSGLLVYGIYQLVEHSAVASADILLFSLVGFIFLGMEYAFKDEDRIRKMFKYISGFISFCAFIFVSVQTLDLKTGHPTFLMFLSYILISINYIYLAYTARMKMFSFLAPVFMVAAGNQCFGLIQQSVKGYDYSVHMFIVGLLIFFGFYFWNEWKYTKEVRLSSGAVSSAVMLFSILHAISHSKWDITGFLFYGFTVVLYIIFKSRETNIIRAVTKWVIPLSFFIGSVALYDMINPNKQNKSYLITFHAMICLFVILCLSLLWRKFEKDLESPFFWIAHIIIPFDAFVLLIEGGFADKANIVAAGYIGVLIVYILSAVKYKAGWKRLLFMYMSFISLTAVIGVLFEALEFANVWFNYVMLIAGMIIAGFWFVSDIVRKKQMAYFLVPYSIIGIYLLNAKFSHGVYGINEFVFTLIWIAIVLFINYTLNWRIIDVFPLFLILVSCGVLRNDILKTDNQMIAVLIAAFIVLKIAGELLSKRLYDFKGRIFIDWYSVIGFIAILFLPNLVLPGSPLWLKLLSPMLVAYTLYSQIKRVGDGYAKSIVRTLAYLGILYPYYTLISELKPPYLYKTELYVLPWITLTIAVSKRVWQDKDGIMKKVELGVLLMVSAVLFKDIFAHYYMTDGLILGVLSLIAIIAGFQIRIKSYFFVGTGTLLLNVIVQTREFWKSIPWWMYLLIAGLILIITASLNEMQKNNKGRKVKIDKRTVIDKFKGWK